MTDSRFTTQSITVYDPETKTLEHAFDVKRGDTVSTIEAMAGTAEANEFYERVVKAEPDRIAPYVSKSGNVVVVFHVHDAVEGQ